LVYVHFMVKHLPFISNIQNNHVSRASFYSIFLKTTHLRFFSHYFNKHFSLTLFKGHFTQQFCRDLFKGQFRAEYLQLFTENFPGFST